MSKLHIIKMGGTIEFIDPAYDAINKQLMKLDTTIETYLQNIIKPYFEFTSENLTDKDSRDINDEDRDRLVAAIGNCSVENVLITHGTFTMADTAEYLEQHLSSDKKVILTGSMIPIVGFATSDAGFNLGFAIASFNGIEPGVYLGMNGGLFKPGEVQKNKEALRFEEQS